MNLETGLISKIETKEDLLHVIDERVKVDFFEEHEEVFKEILNHYSKYQTVIEKDTLAKLFPNFKFSESNEPLQFFIDKIKEKHKKKLYTKGLTEVAELMSKDINDAEKKLQQLLLKSKNEIKSGIDLDIRVGAESRIAEYLKKKGTAGVDGYSTSWPYLDDLTCGYHGGELVIWIAKQKIGKTWIALWQARHIWREHRVPCVFVTKEMGRNAIWTRIETIECKLPYKALKRGFLTEEQQARYFQYKRDLEKDTEMPEFIVHDVDLSDSRAGVSSLVPLVERYLLNGGALFVDGLYLLPDDRGETDWKAMVNIAADLKSLALGYNIPIITTTQHNLDDKSNVPHIEGAAYGKYIVQFADVILGIGISETDKAMHRGGIYILGQREGDIGNFIINMNFDPIDFSQQMIKTVDMYNEYDDEEEYNV